MTCFCCEKNIPCNDEKHCPVCGHVFMGDGWTGIDAHWKAKHENVMPYELFWVTLCEQHKKVSLGQSQNQKDKPHQRIGSISNAHVGRDFESAVLQAFADIGMRLQENVSVEVGIAGSKKGHAFDLGCEEQCILVECKSHRWTSGNNVPSAKMTTWNEAMYYFHAAPAKYRKIMVVLRDFSEKRNETLLSYYLRTHSHLIPSDVEFWEYDSLDKSIERIYN